MRERLAKRDGRPATLARICRACENPMRPSRSGKPGLCKPCKRLAGYKIEISRPARLAIYERDSWVCQFCLEAVDPKLHHNDPFAATLDHIVPRSLGGGDNESNLRLVHRWCNSIRKDSSALTLDEFTAA